jgi:hypothetical protein
MRSLVILTRHIRRAARAAEGFLGRGPLRSAVLGGRKGVLGRQRGVRLRNKQTRYFVEDKRRAHHAAYVFCRPQYKFPSSTSIDYEKFTSHLKRVGTHLRASVGANANADLVSSACPLA